MSTTTAATAVARPLLSEEARKLLFTEARTHQYFLPTPVPDAKLEEMFSLWKFGPTSANTNPARVLFVKSAEGKAALLPCLMEPNQPKAATAPVTAIIAYDTEFYEELPRLAPPMAGYVGMFKSTPEFAKGTAEQSSALQAAYFILAARAVGLDAGPMAGFDRAAVDATFFAKDAKRANWKSQMVINLGYGDASKLYPRFPRFDFDEVTAFA